MMIERIPLIGKIWRKAAESGSMGPTRQPTPQSEVDEGIVSFYAFGNTSNERMRMQLAEQFPNDPDKVERIIQKVTEIREKKSK